MAATTWTQMTRMEPRSWLLGTGEIVTEPALEMTASGRKVRVAGTTESVYHYDTEQMLFAAATALAEQKQTHIHAEITKPLNVILAEAVGYDPATTKAKLHLVHAAADPNAKTIVWWRFKDTNSPFEVLLTVRMHNEGHGRNAAGVQRINTTLTVPCRTYFAQPNDGNDTGAFTEESDRFQVMVNQIARLSYDHQLAWEAFIRDNPIQWTDVLGTPRHTTLKGACADLLSTVRAIDDLDSIEVPDFGDPDNPSWRTLDLYDTNYNQALTSDLTEYLEGAPTVERAAELYTELLATLRACGIVLDESVNSNDFQAALLAGDNAVLGVRVYNLAGDAHCSDDEHKLSMHLPTGTFIVECNRREVSKDEVAEKWEEAHTMASLTGQQDVLLAFSQQYAKEHRKTRTKKILKERTTP